jgi:hypothetical protein
VSVAGADGKRKSQSNHRAVNDGTLKKLLNEGLTNDWSVRYMQRGTLVSEKGGYFHLNFCFCISFASLDPPINKHPLSFPMPLHLSSRFGIGTRLLSLINKEQEGLLPVLWRTHCIGTLYP